MRSAKEIRSDIDKALNGLAKGDLLEGGVRLFKALGYISRKTLQLDGAPQTFLSAIPGGEELKAKAGAATDQWRSVHFLFQLTNDEIPSLAQGQTEIAFGSADFQRSAIDSFVFLAIDLAEGDWSRGALAAITREINRVFPMPAIILFRNGTTISLAVIDRRRHKRDGARDVIDGRISIIKDVSCVAPHRAHIDTMCDIELTKIRVKGIGAPTNFRDLYDGWIEALSIQALNERFYKQLATWFLWSSRIVTFPSAARHKGEERAEQNQIAIIRLLTRLIFVWFIKERGLVPDALFRSADLKAMLVEDPASHPDSSAYYKAVLQNLFFATLNTEMSDDRDWRRKGKGGGLDGQYLIHSKYRFEDAFSKPERARELFRSVPFLNGGLFECLDREITEAELERNPGLAKLVVQEGAHQVIRIDGFSERPDNPLVVPNKIFFSPGEAIDLNDDFQTTGRNYEAKGLIELFSGYKFTVEENTPLEEEVALDPELLGKVFENLLASYNAETKTTARKKSGSFYTPREVVDYMVDEALVAYFLPHLHATTPAPSTVKPVALSLDLGAGDGELDLPQGTPKRPSAAAASDFGPRLRDLFAYGATDNPFTPPETDILIKAIEGLRAIDPACGSGAFPMGLLQKLMHVLHRLDPDNARWKAQNRLPLEARLAAAREAPDPSRRDTEISEAEAALARLDRDFSNANRPDYARKLYLIDKCLFGVDIQPIAVQIAKLRFFISLVVSQNIDRAEDNCNITALPNLETKLVAANSLIPIERPSQSDLFRNPAIEAKEDELRGMNARYFGARSMKTKRARREDIGRLRDELSHLLKADRGLPEADARKMAAWDPFDQNTHADFFDPEWMFGLARGFDLVIGNPPYVRHESIKELKPQLERYYGGKDANGNPRGVYAGSADLLVYFIQRGIELLNPGGAFAYITSNKWFRAKYGERLRTWVNRNTQLCRIIDFGDAEVFDAIAYPAIVIATRRDEAAQAPSSTDTFRVLNWPGDRDRSEVAGFPSLVDTLGFDIPQKTLSPDGWQLEPQARRELLDRLRAAGVPLSKYVEGQLYYGIKTGFNKAFVLSDEERDEIVSREPKAKEIIRRLVRGRDVKRWRSNTPSCWLIFLPWHFPLHESGTLSGASETAEQKFRDQYPVLYAHMQKFKPALAARDRSETGIRYEWYALQRPREYWRKFLVPKIIFPSIENKPSYAVDEEGLFGNDKTNIIVSDNYRYLAGILNSPISWWLVKETYSSRQGGYYEFKPMYVAQFPVPNASQREIALIDTLVRCIVGRRPDGRLEQLLNGLVYELYFEKDFQARGLALFAEVERAGLGQFSGLNDTALPAAIDQFAESNLTPGARLRTMLSDLQTLDVVRLIEGKA